MKVRQGMALGAGILLLAVGAAQAQESFVISGPLDIYIDLDTSEKNYDYSWEATVTYAPTPDLETYSSAAYDQSFFYDSILSIEYAIYDADANLIVAGVETADVGNVVSVLNDRDLTDSTYDTIYWFGSDPVSTVRTQASISFADSSSTMVSSVMEYPSPPVKGEYDLGGTTFYQLNTATGEGFQAHGRVVPCSCQHDGGDDDGGEEVPEESLPGRMTGGGSIFGGGSVRVTHGFQLRCDSTDPRQNLQINWDRGNRFHLTSLDSVSCTDDPSIDPENPTAFFDTYSAVGEGRCNGVEGATVMFTFQDAGEPGVDDFAEIAIEGCPAGNDITVSGLLRHGNHQAHKDK